MTVKLVLLLSFFLAFNSIAQGQQAMDTPGVSSRLATYRRGLLRDIHYDLVFSIPADAAAPVEGKETIIATLWNTRPSRYPLLLDFKAPASAIHALWVNGRMRDRATQHEHLSIPAAWLHPGGDTICIEFTAGNAALNRNSDFLYTLLVPERARTLFPCFDQPDLKALFSLTLTVPEGWRVLGNAPLLDSVVMGDSCRFRFRTSDPISTYLFSFVAGRWASCSQVVDGRTMQFLYRETDSAKLRLSPDPIFRIEGQALRFMQDYTGIAYPFRKFDFVAVPDFQFGGMEHPGAIQYKASSLFLDSGATREQYIGRSNLLSHETAHMWFGDLVSIRWFNDVWMKEVFANFMADKIGRVTLPDDNYELKFLTDHYPAAYSVDRTGGTHPIRQQLDNLQEAGSLYGNIIYHKAPIVMRELERVLGPDVFREGVRDYLRTYAWHNAGWSDLIRALQRHTTVDLGMWNRMWVEGAGRPSIVCTLKTEQGHISELALTQNREDGSAGVWPQVFSIALVYPGRIDTFTVHMETARVRIAAAAGRETPQCVLPDYNGHGYGIFSMDARAPGLLLEDSTGRLGAVTRAALYINFYENMLAGHGLSPRQLLEFDRQALAHEREELNLNILLDQLASIYWRFLPSKDRNDSAAAVENDLWQTMLRVPEATKKKLLFRTYSNMVLSKEGQERLYAVWKDQLPPAGVKLSEDDYTGLAAALALREYPGYANILKEQLDRIKNSDRRARWQFLWPSLSADSAERDRFFASLKDPQVRRKEAWVLTALSYLHSPLRTRESEKYLPATLEWLSDIQQTGDVFFPQSWLQVSFGYYQTASAAAIVRRFLKAHPDYPPKLKAKILQATDNLFRAEKLVVQKEG
jgi:aminopeptidase N